MCFAVIGARSASVDVTGSGKPTIAGSLSEWAVELRDRTLPRDVVDLAKTAVLDFCALAIAGTRDEAGRAALEAFATYSLAPDGSVVLGTGNRLSPGDAAMLNGLLAHVMQADDGMRRAQGHPGAVVLPAALAAAEVASSSGADFLRAVVTGYEVYARLGEAMNPPSSPSHLRRGFHTSGTVGAVAAAAAAAQGLGLDAQATADALGLAGSIGGGLMEFAPTGTMATYLVTGNAARVGVQASMLGREGFTGPHSIVEGPRGMAAAMTDGIDPAVAIADLDDYRIRGTYFKPYPSCRHTHAAIDAALLLSAPEGIDPDSISKVELRTYALAVEECDLPNYSSVAGADSSLYYAVATALRYGRFGFDERTLAAVNDPVTRSLAGRLVIVHDRAFQNRVNGGRPARVTVQMRDGSVRDAEVQFPRGEPEMPMTEAELQQKAYDGASPVIGDGGVSMLLSAVENLAHAASVDELALAATVRSTNR